MDTNNNNSNNNSKSEIGIQSVINNNNWNDIKIMQLRRKMVELKIYHYLHKEAGNYYKKLHKQLFLPQTTIMTVSSGTLFISLTDKINDSGRYWINLFVSFLTLIGTILSVWVKFFDADNIANNHFETSKTYSLIIEDIEEELSLDYEEKTNYVEYINKIKKMINDAKKKALDIDKKFWNQYFNSISKGELIMLNNNIINNEVNKEINSMNYDLASFDIKDYRNTLNHNFDNININQIKKEIKLNIDESSNINNNNTNNTNNNIDDYIKYPRNSEIIENIQLQNNNLNFDKNTNNTNNNNITDNTYLESLKKNIKYQLERNL